MRSMMDEHKHSALLTHEAVCAQRYHEILQKLDRMAEQQEKHWNAIQQLQLRLSYGNGAVRAVLFVGSVIAGVVAFLKLLQEKS